MHWEKVAKEREEDVGTAVEQGIWRHNALPLKGMEKEGRRIGKEGEKDGVAKRPTNEERLGWRL